MCTSSRTSCPATRGRVAEPTLSVRQKAKPPSPAACSIFAKKRPSAHRFDIVCFDTALLLDVFVSPIAPKTVCNTKSKKPTPSNLVRYGLTDMVGRNPARRFRHLRFLLLLLERLRRGGVVVGGGCRRTQGYRLRGPRSISRNLQLKLISGGAKYHRKKSPQFQRKPDFRG